MLTPKSSSILVPVSSYNVPGLPPENMGANQFKGPVKPYQSQQRQFIDRIRQITTERSSISVPAGTTFVNRISVQLTQDNLILAKIYRTIWLDAVSGAGFFPYGSSVDMSLYPYYETDSEYFMGLPVAGVADLSRIDDNQDQSIVVIKNGDASTHIFLIDGRVRYITNQGGLGASS